MELFENYKGNYINSRGFHGNRLTTNLMKYIFSYGLNEDFCITKKSIINNKYNYSFIHLK